MVDLFCNLVVCCTGVLLWAVGFGVQVFDSSEAQTLQSTLKVIITAKWVFLEHPVWGWSLVRSILSRACNNRARIRKLRISRPSGYFPRAEGLGFRAADTLRLQFEVLAVNIQQYSSCALALHCGTVAIMLDSPQHVNVA